MENGLLEMVGGSISSCAVSGDKFNAYGGGLQVSGGIANVSGIEIDSCSATTNANPHGGALQIYNALFVAFTACHITNCWVFSERRDAFGGGIQMEGVDDASDASFHSFQTVSQLHLRLRLCTVK